MRFVWVAREVPLNPDSGLVLYSNGLLRGLLESGATGTLIAHARPQAEGAAIPGLELCVLRPPRRIRMMSLFTSLHSDAYRFKSRRFGGLLQGLLLNEPDVLIIDYFSTAWVLSIVERVAANRVKLPLIVHIAHNYETLLRIQVAESIENPVMRQVLRFDANKAARLEKRIVNACDLLVAISDEDKDRFQNDFPNKRIVTLTPAYDGEIRPTRRIDKSLPRRVVLVGAFEWIAKQTNLRNFLKSANRRLRPAGIELLVVGRVPESLIVELSDKYPFCKFTGRVDRVEPYLKDARIGVMPHDVGGGFKLKCLYYIFAGLAVATIRSQFTGMPVDMDRDVIARDTLDELVSAIAESIDDVEKLEGMRQRCWSACATAFNWAERGRRLRQHIDLAAFERQC
jgi:polysaccharide biosynthesis protein PslH